MNPEQPAERPTANSRLQQLLAKSEHKGEEIFIRRAPFQLPEGLSRVIAAAVPWLVTFILLISVPLLILAITYGATLGLSGDGFRPLYYLSVIVFLAITVLMVMSVPALFNRQAKGWRLIYGAVLVNIGYAVFRWLGELQAYYSLFWSLIFTTVALYVLFQVRRYYR